MRYPVLIFLLLLLAQLQPCAGATNAVAAPGAKAVAESKGRGLPFHGTIAAIDKSAKTITMEGKKQRVFHITAETKIHKDKAVSNLAAVTAGATVGGYAREMPDGKLNLVTLNINSAASKPPKAAK